MTEAESTVRSRSPFLVFLARIPGTLTLLALLLVVGVVSQGLWSPTEEQPWFEYFAFGMPAFEEGRWWTPVTGTFLVVQPWVFIPTLIGLWGMGYLEYRRGTRVALLYFTVGQLFAVCATILFVWIAAFWPWPWAIGLTGQYDAGASGGSMACIAAAIGLFVAPWRQRAWLVLFAFSAISLLFLGSIADVEHAFAVLLILAVDRSFRIQRTTVREQRLLAFATIIGLGIIQLIVMLTPTSGPFGDTTFAAPSLVDVLVDSAVIVIAALGLRRGRRWGWLVALLLSALNILIGLLSLTLLLAAPGDVEDIIGDVDVSIAAGALWLAFAVFLIASRRAFRIWRRKSLAGDENLSVDEVKDVIREHGAGTLSWMTTWERMEYLRTSDGVVPFQTHNGVAIVLADPLGPRESIGKSARQFIDAAEAQALTPCFFSASRYTREALPEGWRAITVADDTIVDLEGLTFQGKAWAKVRQSFSRADREGMSFRVTTYAEEPFAVREQLRAISEQWVGDKGLPEMRFTLGTLAEAEDPEVRLALALAPDGTVDGMLSWLPVYGAGGRVRGWTLDLMRRRDGGFPAVMEFLIGSSAKTFAEEGAQLLSLSGAPLAHETSPDEGTIGRLLGKLGGMLEPVYGFRSLHQFKKKFNPRYEPIYLLYRDEGDLTRIGTGLTRAFLPDATLSQFAAAGLDLVRGK